MSSRQIQPQPPPQLLHQEFRLAKYALQTAKYAQLLLWCAIYASLAISFFCLAPTAVLVKPSAKWVTDKSAKAAKMSASLAMINGAWSAQPANQCALSAKTAGIWTELDAARLEHAPNAL